MRRTRLFLDEILALDGSARRPTDRPVAAPGRWYRRAVSAHPDQPSVSPWIVQLADDGPPQPLEADTSADVVVVGAGIAGVATAFFVLRATAMRVLLLERDRVGRGATGRNAGQLTTYFERPLSQIADEFGVERAGEAQRAFDDAHGLFDLMVQEAGVTARVERFTGHMGMFNRHHVQVHLRNNLVRRQAGLRLEGCLISAESGLPDQIPAELAGLYEVVPAARVHELLEIDDDRYSAVLSDVKGCANSGLVAQEVLAHLERRYADRFRFADHTGVERIVVGDERRRGARQRPPCQRRPRRALHQRLRGPRGGGPGGIAGSPRRRSADHRARRAT